MMKKIILLILLVMPMAMAAQQLSVGYLSHNEVLRMMPQYAKAQEELASLRAQYEAEAKRSEEEFQRKFVEFTEGQQTFSKTILQKRQNELQNLMDTNSAFRRQVQTLLQQAENDLMQDVRAILIEAVQAVAQQQGLFVVLNTDGDSLPYIHPSIGINIKSLVMQQLGIEEQVAEPQQ